MLTLIAENKLMVMIYTVSQKNASTSPV